MINEKQYKIAPNMNSMIDIHSVIYYHLSHTWRAPSKAVNLRSCYRFYLLILVGDVAQKPGPIAKLKHLCGSTICKQKTRTVAANHRAVLCEACYKWFHINCANISAAEYNNLRNHQTHGYVPTAPGSISRTLSTAITLLIVT